MSYNEKSEGYYSNPREDVFAILKDLENKSSILEIGCGFGGLGRRLIQHYKPSRIDGIELNPNSEILLRKSGYSNVFIGDAHDILLKNKDEVLYDLIIMADVLEHMVNDIEMLKIVTKKLNFQGHLLVSVPNVTNWQLIRNLYFKKTFPRDLSGIFDSTHMRWYTKKDIIDLCLCEGMILESYKSNKDCFNPFFDMIVRPIFEIFSEDIFVSQHLLLLKRV
jgi:2-polyprenyl-3-methyl-5-hydroxy-6-metoxy-1,4-benzoquinol methylase